MRLAAAHRRGALAPALPLPYPQLHKAGLRVRRGQMSLTAAASSVGKSQLWNNIAQRMNAPSVYWSADTDAHEVLMRSLAMWSGATTEDVERNRREKSWADYYTKLLKQGSHVEWIFESAVTPEGVSERLGAFAEVHGEYPHLFVIDNLSNAVENQQDALALEKDFVIGMQQLARRTHAHIAVLAHVKGEYENGTKPIPKNGVLNNLMKWPELGLTLYAPRDGEIGVCVVKNRGGKSDPAAQHPIRLSVDFGRATVGGFDAAVAA